ncbi:MAG TPA: hypothetical protein VF213_11590, partial [Dongiaceae bacterium]
LGAMRRVDRQLSALVGLTTSQTPEEESRFAVLRIALQETLEAVERLRQDFEEQRSLQEQRWADLRSRIDAIAAMTDGSQAASSTPDRKPSD